MAKIDPLFQHDAYKFIHLPIRVADKIDGNLFLERFLTGVQANFERTQLQINTVPEILNPAKTRADLLQYLKDHVGFTKELNNITNGLSESDLRKLISLAVALWKQKGTDVGYANIVRLFTGATARIFNWFDFRMIVGEKAFGEEQLGEDSWFISVPGVEASNDPANIVVDLLTFEQNAKDRSLARNHGQTHGTVSFFATPSSGFPQGSKFYARFIDGVITQPNTATYDLSGPFTWEAFIRTTEAQAGRYLVNKRDGGGKGFAVKIDTVANEITAIFGDGVDTVTANFVPVADLDDGQPRHIAVVVSRAANQARIFVGGSEASPLIDISTIGDMSSIAQIVVGGEAPIVNKYLGDMDNMRLCLSLAYPVTNTSIVPPISGFIEFNEEQLDEYFTDVRIVDSGSLNKTLILRILNLMRPSSERLNVIFITVFDDFIDGVGAYQTLAGSMAWNSNKKMELQPLTIVATDVLNDTEWRDIVLQVKAQDLAPAGGKVGILFFVQDVDNYYEFRCDTSTGITQLWKIVAGVATQIGADKTEDMVPEASYIYTIYTSYNPSTGETLIQTHVDSNQMHEVIDLSFNKGKFGMKTGLGINLEVQEVEMFQLPVDVRQVLPGFDL